MVKLVVDMEIGYRVRNNEETPGVDVYLDKDAGEKGFHKNSEAAEG